MLQSGQKRSWKNFNQFDFIISRDGATAADIERLILHVQKTVRDVHGVDLVPEVRMAGEDPR